MKDILSPSRLRRSFAFAGKGIGWVFQSEPNFRIHLGVAVLVIVAGALLRLSTVEWALVSLSIGIVLAAESLNTAVELLADAVHPDRHELIGKAKDVSAGAVLWSAIASAAVGAVIFLPKIWELFQP